MNINHRQPFLCSTLISSINFLTHTHSLTHSFSHHYKTFLARNNIGNSQERAAAFRIEWMWLQCQDSGDLHFFLPASGKSYREAINPSQHRQHSDRVRL